MEGFKDCKGKLPLHTVFTKQFPKALIEIAKRSEYGHQKYIEQDEDYLNFKRVPNAIQEYKEARMRHNMCLGEDSETYLDHLIAATWNGLAEIELILDEPKYEAKRSGIIDPIWDTKRVGAITYESFVAADSTQKEKLDENYDFIKVINSSKNEKIPFVELTEKEFIENYKP